MPIELTNAGPGAPFSGNYQAELLALQERLARLQCIQLVYRRRAIVIFEGWEGAGLRATLKRLVSSFDPCHVSTHCTGSEEEFDRERHWLAPYWERLPSGGGTSLFLRSWYRKLADNRLTGNVDDDRLARYCDEINEFEAQQGDHDTIVVKLFFDVSSEVQSERLAERRADPWKKLLMDQDQESMQSEHRDEARDHWNAIFAQTDTRWAPWKLVDGNDKRSARIAALGSVADVLEKALPSEPPASRDNVVHLKKKA